MQMALPFQSQCLHSRHSFLSHRIASSRRKLPSPTTFFPFLHRKSPRFTRFVLNLIPIIASNFKLSTCSLHLIPEELGSGEALGGDDLMAGREGGWRKQGFWVILIVCRLSLTFEGEIESQIRP
ncbi:hypothetical protein ACJRO7_008853 [Eucalyptus globulus]|uniref:Uncharacterized protein n=1 Tax=Eucalyptus globulus TaxID=34317 RepID=A0ABD3ITL5_EUCGL